MEKKITITLSRNDVGQILDGLNQRMISWRMTAEYLVTGHCRLGEIIEEANAIAEHYQNIIDQITEQLS